jgi:NADH-quinone oxidoreductase subunit E
MLGGDEIYEALSADLGIGHNETSADGTITLEHAECLAACDYAPVVTVNYEFFDNQTVGSARNVVSQLQSGERPMPTRGAPLCTFKQIERQVAGFFDEQTLARDSVSSGGPTEAGVKLAIERGHTAPSYSLDGERSEQPEQGELPLGGDAPQPSPRKRAPRKASPADQSISQQPTSQHDAPLSTSASDDAHPAKPAGEEAK